MSRRYGVPEVPAATSPKAKPVTERLPPEREAFYRDFIAKKMKEELKARSPRAYRQRYPEEFPEEQNPLPSPSNVGLTEIFGKGRWSTIERAAHSSEEQKRAACREANLQNYGVDWSEWQ